MPHGHVIVIPNPGRILGGRIDALVSIVYVNGGIATLGKGVDPHPDHQASRVGRIDDSRNDSQSSGEGPIRDWLLCACASDRLTCRRVRHVVGDSI